MRVIIHLPAPQADALEQLGNQFSTFIVGRTNAVDRERLADDLAGGHARVERRERVLENDLHLAAIGPQFAFREVGYVAPVKLDRTGGWFDEAHQGAPDRGFATT